MKTNKYITSYCRLKRENWHLKIEKICLKIVTFDLLWSSKLLTLSAYVEILRKCYETFGCLGVNFGNLGKTSCQFWKEDLRRVISIFLGRCNLGLIEFCSRPIRIQYFFECVLKKNNQVQRMNIVWRDFILKLFEIMNVSLIIAAINS